MIGRTNAKTAGRNVFAFIVVTYPSGGICTATNGVTTLKARDTSGSWLFRIPNRGTFPQTWTVNCTDGTNTASQTVIINFKGQSERVDLGYEIIYVFAPTNLKNATYSSETHKYQSGSLYENSSRCLMPLQSTDVVKKETLVIDTSGTTDTSPKTGAGAAARGYFQFRRNGSQVYQLELNAQQSIEIDISSYTSTSDTFEVGFYATENAAANVYFGTNKPIYIHNITLK